MMTKGENYARFSSVMLRELFPLAPIAILFIAPISTLLLSVLLSKFVLRFFPKWKILDHPEKYGHKRQPIPYPGGVSIPLSFLTVLLLFFPPETKLLAFAGGGILLAIISFYDDRCGIHPVVRLGIQILIGFLLITSGTAIWYIANPFDPVAFELPPLVATVGTIVWIIALINTVNWLDGVPGAAAGTSTIAGLFLGVLSLSPGVNQPELAAMCFVFAAANAGFLFFNIAPPKMLNGDTGAMFSGFCIAVLAIFSGGKMATAFLVLALPMFDAFAVIFHRLREHKSPLQGRDQRHLHDQLLKRGFSERQVLALFLTIAAVLGISALYLHTLGKIILLILLGIFVFSISWRTQSK